MQDDKVTSKQNKIRIRQRNAGMTYRKWISVFLCVIFVCGLLAGCGNDKVQEEPYELFKVLIGDDSSEVVGSLTDDTGTQRNVYLHVEELPADSGLEETEQTRFYAMQEDLNYLIDHLS